MKELKERFWRHGTSDMKYERTVCHSGGQKLRVSIRRNSYLHQSEAMVHLWVPAAGGWVTVINVPVGELECANVKPCGSPNELQLFAGWAREDANALLAEATDIIS
jgi:hypothetical protein